MVDQLRFERPAWLRPLPMGDGDAIEHRAPVVQITTHGGRELRWRLPAPERDLETGSAVRRLAACVNNLAMVHGARRTQVVSSMFAPAVDAEVDHRYPQVRRLAGAFDARTDTRPSTYSCRGWTTSPSRIPTAAALGVNVGQSFIKGVATATDGTPVARVLMPTGAEHRSGSVLRERTLEVVRRLHAAGPSPTAIGLCVGGIVRDGYIQPGSGVTLGLSDADAALLSGLGVTIETEFGHPVLTAQDARCKAYYAAARHGVKGALVLDLGTSLGGCYIDEAGCVPDLLNQVGRVAYDLADNALMRRDGQGRGLLSQYLSTTGAVRAARELGVELDGHPPLQEWLDSDGTRTAELVQLFRSRLRKTIMLLSCYYDLDRIVITGGLMTGGFGDRVLALKAGDGLSDGIEATRSAEPLYDAALGAAWAAANAAMSHAQLNTPSAIDAGEQGE